MSASLSPGPLDGLRVLEIESLAPAPFACMMLAQLGAEVVTVRRPRAADAPDLLGRAGKVHDPLQQGRASITRDLTDPHDRAEVLGLVEACDVFVEGFRPGVAERLGLGPDVVRALNPGVVYARMTGWGQHGPRSGTAGHDINYLALTGALDAIGQAGGPPTPPLNLVADFGGGGMLLVVGVLAALHSRQADGIGDVVDAAMVDGVASLTSFLHGMSASGSWSRGRGTNVLDGSAPFYRTYETADGLYVAVGAVEDRFYSALVAGLDLAGTDLPDRWNRDHWTELGATFAQRFRMRTRAGWDAVFGGSDACVTPVLGLHEAAHDAHLRSRETFVAESPFPTSAPRFARHAHRRTLEEADGDDLLTSWRAAPRVRSRT
jgi:alpha-methylacyl-CoA racemase